MRTLVFAILILFLIVPLIFAQGVGVQYGAFGDNSYSFAAMQLKTHGPGLYISAGESNAPAGIKNYSSFINAGIIIAQNPGVDLYGKDFLIYFYAAAGVQSHSVYKMELKRAKGNFAGGLMLNYKAFLFKFGINSADTFEYGLGLKF